MPSLIIAMTALKVLKLKSLISRSNSILALLGKLLEPLLRSLSLMKQFALL